MAGPTRERMNKPDWEQAGKKRRKSDTLAILRPRVGDEVIAEAQRWITDWELAVNGYCDAMKNGGQPPVPGDVFTFNALRGKAWRPIKDFWHHAGHQRHRLLVQMLAYGWSFAAIGRYNWPHLSERWRNNKAATECQSALIMLAEFWRQQRKSEAGRAIAAARLYRACPSLPPLCRQFNLAAPGMRRLIASGEKMLGRPKHGLTATA